MPDAPTMTPPHEPEAPPPPGLSPAAASGRSGPAFPADRPASVATRRSRRARVAGGAGGLLRAVLFLLALYAFLLSIDLMGVAFRLFGQGFAGGLLGAVSDPLAGLFAGLLVTSLVQSSSFTTSLTVGLVAAGTLPLPFAVPVVMGANIGTTVTNTFVSLGHVRRPEEFARAFAAGTVHDFFNVLAAAVLFPIELLFHPIERSAVFLGQIFTDAGGLHLISPLKMVIHPVSTALAEVLPLALLLLAIALVLLFTALSQMVRIMRGAVMTRVEGLFDRVLFRNDGAGFLFGWLLTTAVQSSSVTTSLIVPLAGTGVLSLRRIYPYTLGANLGTTVTAILAAFASVNPLGIMVAGAHLIFNVLGILIFYPARALPLVLACWAGRVASRSRRSTTGFLLGYLALHLLPLLYILLH